MTNVLLMLLMTAIPTLLFLIVDRSSMKGGQE